MEKTQKDYYLNEQMRAIHKEMGTQDSHKAELDELEKKIKSEKSCPRKPMCGVKQEFKKLKMMSPMSAEATVVRNYIDWIHVLIPWREKTKVKLNVEEAEKPSLMKITTDLKSPKERILEYLAVQRLTKKDQGPHSLPGGSSGGG